MDNIKVSTKTIIGTSNLQIDIQKIFLNYPLGNDTLGDYNVNIQTIYYGSERRGVPINEKKKKKKSFRNAVNLIAYVNTHKKINFKVSKNGKFQLTGCKSEENAIELVSYFINKLFKSCPNAVTILKGIGIKVYFQTVMTNVDFSIGYFINRQKLDELMNKETSHYSLLETSCGYTRVNIKFLLESKWWELPIPIIICKDINKDIFEWQRYYEPFNEIVEIPIEKKQKKKYNTFLVFHSGNIIMSGMMKETMEKQYEIFINLLKKWRPEIEEKILEN